MEIDQERDKRLKKEELAEVVKESRCYHQMMDDNQEEQKRLEKEVIKELAQYYMNINIQVLVIMGVSMISRSWNEAAKILKKIEALKNKEPKLNDEE